jgi:hypothetical protein
MANLYSLARDPIGFVLLNATFFFKFFTSLVTLTLLTGVFKSLMFPLLVCIDALICVVLVSFSLDLIYVL